MYTVITKYIRQDAKTPYYLDHVPELSPLFLYFVEQYDHLVNLTTLEPSDLIQINFAVYKNEGDFNTFMAAFNAQFPTFFNDRDSYCQNNNIQIERSVEAS